MSSRNLLTTAGSACALLLFAFTAADAAQAGASSLQMSETTAASGKILFNRSVSNPDGSVRSGSLFRVNADGSGLQQLTPTKVGIYDTSPSWSPGGGQIVYARLDADLDKYDLYLMNSRGQGAHRLTSGANDFHTPVWGPAGRIAFVSDHPGLFGLPESCVDVIRADGSHHQRDLFCPPNFGSRPTRVFELAWSADGNSLYVDSGYPPLEGWFSATFKVDARTGAVTESVSKSFDFRPSVSFAPDGSNAIYSGDFMITRIDFASGQRTVLVDDQIYAGLYSRDGSKIAFTRRFFPTPDVHYDHLFVMNADGSNVRQLTKGELDNLEYVAADWSDDGKQLLVNRAIYSEDERGGRVNPRRALRIVDVATKAITPIRAGYAYHGAWFESH